MGRNWYKFGRQQKTAGEGRKQVDQGQVVEGGKVESSQHQGGSAEMEVEIGLGTGLWMM
jgi:hypothetical protein